MNRAIEHHPVFGHFRRSEGRAEPGHQMTFLGTKIAARYWGGRTDPALGLVKPELPRFDEEYFEWIDLLEAVRGAQDEFVMVELGAGFGRWLANAVAALRASSAIPYRLIGVEAEPTHYLWMREHLATNGVDLSRCELHEAAVAARAGQLWFHVGRPTEWYGQAIAHRSMLRRLLTMLRVPPTAPEEIKRVKAVTLREILEPLRKVDLIDLDVQGAEADVLEGAAEELCKVCRVHIGTHGAQIEAALRRLFGRLGWRKVNDYACNTESDTPYGRIKFQDGVQTWINPAPD